MPENQAALAIPEAPEQDLILALAGDQGAAGRLHAKYSPLIHHAAARRIRSLPEDLHEEVVQEVWLLLFQRYGFGGQAVTQPAKELLLSLVGHAVDAVRSAYRLPGQRARFRNERRDGEAPEVPVVQVALSLDAAEAVGSVALIVEDPSYRQVEARFDLDLVMRNVPRDIGATLEVMLDSDISMSAAGVKTGVNRSRLQRWAASIRQLAA